MSRLNITRFINGHKPALHALSKVNSNLCVLQEYRRKQIFRTHSTRDRKVDPFTKTVNLSLTFSLTLFIKTDHYWELCCNIFYVIFILFFLVCYARMLSQESCQLRLPSWPNWLICELTPIFLLKWSVNWPKYIKLYVIKFMISFQAQC